MTNRQWRREIARLFQVPEKLLRAKARGREALYEACWNSITELPAFSVYIARMTDLRLRFRV